MKRTERVALYLTIDEKERLYNHLRDTFGYKQMYIGISEYVMSAVDFKIKVDSMDITDDLSRISAVVSEVFEVTLDEMKSSKKPDRLVWPRQCFFYWARIRTQHILKDIGHFTGRRDHSTVSHGSQTWSEYVDGGFKSMPPYLKEGHLIVEERLNEIYNGKEITTNGSQEAS